MKKIINCCLLYLGLIVFSFLIGHALGSGFRDVNTLIIKQVEPTELQIAQVRAAHAYDNWAMGIITVVLTLIKFWLRSNPFPPRRSLAIVHIRHTCVFLFGISMLFCILPVFICGGMIIMKSVFPWVFGIATVVWTFIRAVHWILVDYFKIGFIAGEGPGSWRVL